MDSKDVTRWVKDRVRSYDDDIDEHPKKALARMQKEIAGINPEGRLEAVRFAKDYATAYYVGRHGDNIPADIKNDIRAFETKVMKMNSVEASCEYIRQAGSPEKFMANLMKRSADYQVAKAGFDTGNAPKMSVSDTIKVNVPQKTKAPAQQQSAGQQMAM